MQKPARKPGLYVVPFDFGSGSELGLSSEGVDNVLFSVVTRDKMEDPDNA